jgi:hypothetical protein
LSRSQNLVDSIILTGRYSAHPDAIASLSVKNDPNLKTLTYDEESSAAEELATFLLQVIPAGILAETYEKIQDKVEMLDELGDFFDVLALEGLSEHVDPKLNEYFALKQQNWNGGSASTEQMFIFIEAAIEYARAPKQSIENI